VDALGRGHYRRYDERTSTMLGRGAELAAERWHDDLRALRREASNDAHRVAALLTEFPGIGPAGGDIFLREVQAVWPEAAPYADRLVLESARKLGLPAEPAALADLAGSNGRLAALAAGLVRVSRSDRAVREITAAGADGSRSH
jgi:hypothetical protein